MRNNKQKNVIGKMTVVIVILCFLGIAAVVVTGEMKVKKEKVPFEYVEKALHHDEDPHIILEDKDGEQHDALVDHQTYDIFEDELGYERGETYEFEVEPVSGYFEQGETIQINDTEWELNKHSNYQK